MYNWQYKNWPNFSYSTTELQTISIAFAQEIGIANGLYMALDDDLQQEAVIEILIAEAIKTSEIEGEYMSREDVMSSIKRNLGLKENKVVRDKRVAGVTKLMTMVREETSEELTLEMILEWHHVLMAGFSPVTAGEWRKGKEPMQVVSGGYDREIVHYEAPPSDSVPQQMTGFVEWFNHHPFETKDQISQALLRASIAHLFFESIHPFEDGNGRIGRAIAEFTLSHTLQSPVLLSISNTIEKNKKQYYDALKKAQSSLEITDWIIYFSSVILDAQKNAKELVEFTLKKAKFFDRYKDQLNERELKGVARMFESGVAGFEGGMTAKKYIAITKTSKATATRDLQHLQEIGVLKQVGAGRSVRYDLVLV